MKRSLQSSKLHPSPLFITSGVALIATTYGLARLGYGLFLPAFTESFALPPGTSGPLSSGASVLYCVAAIVGFRHATAHPRAVAVLAGLSAAIGSAGIAAAPDASIFAAAVLLAGTGAGFASPALVELVRRNSAPTRERRAQSVVNAGTGFGVVAAGLLSLLLGDEWRVAWILVSALAVASMLGVLLSDQGKPAEGARAPRPSLVAADSFRGLARPLIGALLFGAGSAAVWVFGRTALESTGGMTATESAGAWMALGAGGACAALTARWLAARSVATSWSASVVGTALATALMPAVPGELIPAYVAAAVFGLAYTAATSVLILWASATAADSAAGTAILFVALVLGQALGSAVLDWLLIRSGPLVAFVAAALMCGTSALVVVGFRSGSGTGPEGELGTGLRTPTTAGPAPLRGWR